MGCGFRLEARSIRSFVTLHKKGGLNLSPVFQRQSVWKPRDREKLINSIYKGFPLPAVFLYKHSHNGRVVYEVIDGKQRLETILSYIRVIRKAIPSFVPRIDLEDSKPTRKTWRDYPSRAAFLNYKLPVLYVSGDLGDINDLFVCINSTGTTLTGAEKTHAKYLNSTFLKTAEKLAEQKKTFFLENKVLTQAQIQRMKHVELICEFMLSVHTGSILDKKKALDQALRSGKLSERDAKEARKATVRTLKLIERICSSSKPTFSETRFAKISDFYTLFVLLFKLDQQEGAVLKDERANIRVWWILRRFGLGVDSFSVKHRAFGSMAGADKLYIDYLRTVQHGSDQKTQRMKREDILRGLLESILCKKDTIRAFSSEQRRVIWNSPKQRKCSICHGKKGVLRWDNCDMDHRQAYSRGGATDLTNAALAHRVCNIRKGAK